MLLLFFLQQPALGATILKASQNQNSKHPSHKAMLFMGERMKELSKGSLTLKIYANGILGNQRETTELLKTGALDIAKTNANGVEAFDPVYGAFNLPYLFRSREHCFRVVDGPIGKKVLESASSKGFFGLAFYDTGARSLYGRKPIRTPADIKGLKFRVQPGQTSIQMLEAMGGSPVPIALGELYTAIQQGVVLGAENNISTYMISRHGEVAPYFSSTEHTMVPDVLLISHRTWQRLTEKERSIVKQAAKESSEEMKKIWAVSEGVFRQEALSQGVKFIDSDRQAFAQMVEPLYEKIRKNKPDVYRVVEEIRSIE